MEEERGISIIEIFKVIFKRVWWVVGVTAAALLVTVLAVQFIFNPQKATYSISYNVEFPDSDSKRYPDGTEFRLSDVVSLKVLNEIKENSDGKFDSVDINKMVGKDDISVELKEVVNTSTSAVTDSHIVLTVKAKYFSGSKQAVDFMRAVAEYPAENAKHLVNISEYTASLTALDQARTYEEQIEYLKAQNSYIKGMYDDLIELYGLYYRVNDRSLDNYRLELGRIFNEMDVNELENELKTNYFVKDSERYLANSEIARAALVKEQNENNLKIEALRLERDKVGSSTSDVETFNAAIVSLVNRNSEIDIQLDKIQKEIESIQNQDKTAQQEFEAKIAKYRNDLMAATETFKAVRIAVYEEKAIVEYRINNITAEGETNIILAAVLGALIGFVAVSIVICIIDLPKYLRQKRLAEKAAANGEELNVQEHTQVADEVVKTEEQNEKVNEEKDSQEKQ